MLKGLTKVALTAALLAGSALSVAAQDITLRATANSNENDEDYDGLVVFKNYVEAASNGRIGVELFIGTQLCSNGNTEAVPPDVWITMSMEPSATP